MILMDDNEQPCLDKIVQAQKNGEARGLTSICSSNK
jgi:hypothetical protein